MNELLLVLLLITDPAAKPAADAVAQRVTDQGAARVVIGPEALAKLREFGVTDADLSTQAAVGTSLTGGHPALAVVRIEREEKGGNIVYQSIVWAGGKREQHVAINGNPGPTTPGRPAAADPIDSVVRGIGEILAPWLAARGRAPAVDVDAQLAGLADRQEWARILNLTDGAAAPSARGRYYRALALHFSGRGSEAEAALTAFRAAAPDHVLLQALERTLHPERATHQDEVDINNAATEDDGSNVLR